VQLRSTGTLPSAGASQDVLKVLRRSWQGEPGRLEVAYATVSDPVSRAGLWWHQEIVAPTTEQQRAAYQHGWIALFPPDGQPVLERFEASLQPEEEPTRGEMAPGLALLSEHSTKGTHSGASSEPTEVRIQGGTDRVVFDLVASDSSKVLWTFPRWSWFTGKLPGAQCVPMPSAVFSGVVTLDGKPFVSWPQNAPDRGRGGIARIFGHGSAKRWCWLHADLGGSDVLELVAAVPKTPGLDKLPPMPLVQVRYQGADWPRDPLVAAPLMKARIGQEGFQVKGAIGRRRLTIEVELPKQRCVSVAYEDPDGSTATCVNSERANVEVLLERRRAKWETEARWNLDATGHAEIGSRP